ncbi:MAG TPA: NFACT family protein, partial [Ktedonobacterales bacterium]|nr:NFACT family protein [Ktedonobacterales bacterium]
MQIDALTLAALADEFQTTLVGARIDDVIQPTPQAVALQCWGGGRNRWLMVSTHPQLARIHFTAEKPRKLAAEPPAFVMLLRKYLEGARVVAVRHPRWERVIEIGFGRGAEITAGTASVWLIVEAMGRNSNITLTDGDAVILGALRLVSAEVNAYRAILPHVPYRYPPPQARTLHGATLPRLDGADVTVSALREAGQDALATYDMPPLAAPTATAPDDGVANITAPATTGAQGKSTGKGGGKQSAQKRKPSARREAPTIAGLLAAQVLGFSRELGSEVAFRALGTPDAAVRADLGEAQWGAVARETRALAALPDAHAWEPTLLTRGPDATRAATEDAAPGPEASLIGFSVYRPQRFPPEITLTTAPSVNEALDRYFRGAEWQSALEGAKGGLRRLLQTQRDRCQRKAEALHGELSALDELSRLRLEADTLLTYQTEIAPGQRVFTIADPFGADAGEPATDDQPLTITLDPQLTAVENANRRYTRYH